MKWIASVLVVAGLLLVGCGDEDGDSGGASTPRPTVASQGVQPSTSAATTAAEPTSTSVDPGVYLTVGREIPGVTVADIKTDGELLYIDEVVGTGPALERGQRAQVHYTGWLVDGTKFDSSVDRGVPYEMQLGANRVIQGWEIGIATMNVGGKRRLIIPASLGYGPEGRPPTIPPNATLIFDVEVLSVQQ